MRTVRAVAKGEPLTFSYINPREQSLERRRRYFLSQHYFDINDEINGRDLQTVKKFDRLPDGFTEELIDSFQDALDAFEEDFEDKVRGREGEEIVRTAKMLYAACEELVDKLEAAVEGGGGGGGVVLIRLKRLFVDIAAWLLAKEPVGDTAEEILCQFVGHSKTLLELQREYLGIDHVDVGRTCLDVAQGVSSLLSQKGGKLSGLGGFLSVVEASKFEDFCRKEHTRIKNSFA
jgi:hypothetical protein